MSMILKESDNPGNVIRIRGSPEQHTGNMHKKSDYNISYFLPINRQKIR